MSKMNREQWLSTMLHRHIAPMMAKHGATVPKDCKVSVGFPGGGSARKRIGECWPRKLSKIGVNEIFINPVMTDVSKIVDILVHEAVHASDDCVSGHKGYFRLTAKAVGLEGKMTATHAGPELSKWIAAAIAKMPAFDYGSLHLSQRTKQTTRMLRYQCGSCDAIFRMSGAWSPFQCPCCEEGTLV